MVCPLKLATGNQSCCHKSQPGLQSMEVGSCLVRNQGSSLYWAEVGSHGLQNFEDTPPLLSPPQSYQVSPPPGLPLRPPSPPSTLQICPCNILCQLPHISPEFSKYCLHPCLFQLTTGLFLDEGVLVTFAPAGT